MDEKAYKQYKRMIARAEVAIDNKPPKFNVSYYYNKRNLTDDANRVRQIDKENIKMLQRMSIITRTRVSIFHLKTFPRKYNRKIQMLKYFCIQLTTFDFYFFIFLISLYSILF